MTLILVIAGPEAVIQISDRRLTNAKAVITDEAGKGFIAHFADARVVVGFTGLARSWQFETIDWLMRAISEEAVDHELLPTMLRMKV